MLDPDKMTYVAIKYFSKDTLLPTQEVLIYVRPCTTFYQYTQQMTELAFTKLGKVIPTNGHHVMNK